MKTYEEIKEYVLSVGSENMGIMGGRFKGGYELQQHPKECSQLLEVLQKNKFINYLEIGVAAGGFTRLLCDLVIVHNVVLIDDGKHSTFEAAYKTNIANLKNTGQIHEFIGNSHSIEAGKFLEDLNLIYDLVLIDGDHSYAGVEQDFEMVLNFTTPESIILLHDVHVTNIGVHIFFKQIQKDPQIKMPYVWNSRFGIAYLKVLTPRKKL